MAEVGDDKHDLGDDKKVSITPGKAGTRISVFGDRTGAFQPRTSTGWSAKETKSRRSSLFVDDVMGATFKGKPVFGKYQDKTDVQNTKCRWNLLWLVLLAVGPYPMWLTFISPGACAVSYEITIIVSFILTVNYIYAAFLCWRYLWRMIRSFNTPFWEELDPEYREKIQHIVVMPTYKEPLDLLMETISSVANQTVADSIVMVVGMEEGTPDQEHKKATILERFENSFKDLVFAVHPKGTPGEIPGACSNRNYASRQAVIHMTKKRLLPMDPVTNEVDLEYTVLTVCDSDTTFFYKYFENLTWCFMNEPAKSRYEVCWQSPLFYNIALDERWFFTRAMGIIRSFFMVGFLIGCDINTMSIYSMSLNLLVESCFFHPGYQMDDIIYTLSAMKATGKRVRIRTIDIPTLSGPTSGETVWKEWEEWVIQATRWTIGAAEVFHYFFVKLLHGNYFLPGVAYFWWFTYYYGFVLCLGGIITLCNFIVGSIIAPFYSPVDVMVCRPMQSWFNIRDDFRYDWIFPCFLFIFYAVVAFTAWCMDALVVQILALNEHVNIVRNFFHWLSTQLVLWAYCLVEYKAIIQIAIYGKAVCGHKASEKGALTKK